MSRILFFLIILHKKKQRTTARKLLVDVDMSWIIRKLGIGLREEVQIKKVVQFLRTLARDGLIVTPICDNNTRHHSKGDSISRERARVDGLFARCKGISLSTQVGAQGGQYTSLQQKEREDINKAVRRVENATFVPIPENFADLLQDEIDIWKAGDPNVNEGRM